MITFIEDAPNITAKELVRVHVEKYLDEVKQLLPELPDDIYIWLDNRHMIHEVGEGGAAHTRDTMNISFDVSFTDRSLQLKSLRGTIYHEAYHMVQGFTHENMEHICTSALDAAVYEGCATVFERQYADVTVPWGDYTQHDTATLKIWKHLLQDVTFDRYVNEDGLWEKLAFYDNESGEHWRLYKTGTWLVDEVLKKSGLDILDLRTKSAREIIDML